MKTIECAQGRNISDGIEIMDNKLMDEANASSKCVIIEKMDNIDNVEEFTFPNNP